MHVDPALLSPVVDLTLDAASASEDTSVAVVDLTLDAGSASEDTTVAAADSGEQTTGPPQQTPVHGRNIARGSIGPAKVALFRWSNNSCAFDAVLAVLVHVWGCLLKDELVPKTMRRRRTRNGGSLLDVVDDLYSQWKEERGTQAVNVKRATALRDEFRKHVYKVMDPGGRDKGHVISASCVLGVVLRALHMPRSAADTASQVARALEPTIVVFSRMSPTSLPFVERLVEHASLFDMVSSREGCEATLPPLIIGFETAFYNFGERVHQDADAVDRLRAAFLPLNVTIAGKRYALCGIIETNSNHFRARIPVLHGQPETYGPPGVYEVNALRQSRGVSLLHRLSPSDDSLPFDCEGDQYFPAVTLYIRCS
jgi:hypothetical protein